MSMGVYIKGMEMPKDKAIAVVIHPDGTAYRLKCSLGLCTKYLTDCEAVPVPPHGRCIDADALYKRYWTEERTLDKPYIDYLGILATESPTIIGEER